MPSSPYDMFLRTKIRVMRPPQGTITRPRLDGVRTEALQMRLVTLSAPGGFGKSTLAATWVAHWQAQGHHCTWLSLSQDEDEPAGFLHSPHPGPAPPGQGRRRFCPGPSARAGAGGAAFRGVAAAERAWKPSMARLVWCWTTSIDSTTRPFTKRWPSSSTHAPPQFHPRHHLAYDAPASAGPPACPWPVARRGRSRPCASIWRKPPAC